MNLTKIRYTIQEASSILSVSVKTLERRIENGYLLGSYKDGRKRFIPRDSIIEYHNNMQKKGY